MRIAFYAPLKAPDHAVPSGDRRMARLLTRALAASGHEVALASRLRSFEGQGDGDRQAAIRAAGTAEAEALIAGWRAAGPAARPQAWLTYHLYHKAPDWIGPAVCAALAIPYLVVEASFAPKRAGGPWAEGHDAVAAALAAAAVVLAPIADDVPCLRPRLRSGAHLLRLAPFLDPAPYRAARRRRAVHRAALATRHGIDPEPPWLLAVAMMRDGDKRASYRLLGAALDALAAKDWRLLVVGDGPARAAVAAALPVGTVFAGAQAPEDLAPFYAATDVFVWPAVNEAYGMATLEALASGLPVVAGRVPGVAELVADDGVLVPPDDAAGFAAALGDLLADPARRAALGRAAARRVTRDHAISGATATLDRALALALAS